MILAGQTSLIVAVRAQTIKTETQIQPSVKNTVIVISPASSNCVLLLGHQGKGLGTDGRAVHQTDGDASQRSRIVNAHDRVKSCANGVDVCLLAVLVSSSCIKDVPSVQD